jgi:dienelactone hydrolase
MKRLYAVSVAFCVALSVVAQKPTLSFDTVNNLPSIRNVQISDDGRYFAYVIDDPVFHTQTLKVRSTDQGWEKEIGDVKGEASFANESHLLITTRGQDTLCLQELGNDRQELIPQVQSFSASKSGAADWLLYRLDNADKQVVVRNLASGKQQSFSGVSGYEFAHGDRAVVLQEQNPDSTSSLRWVDLVTGTNTQIWQGKSHGRLKFSLQGNAVAFFGSTDVRGRNGLWYYKAGDDKAVILLAENNSDDSTQGLNFGYLTGFNDKGDKLSFTFQATIKRQTEGGNLANVDIYSYKDPKLQSQQLKELKGRPLECTYFFNIQSHKFVVIERKNEHLMSPITELQRQDFVLIRKDGGGATYDEWNWNPDALSSVYLVSTADGTRKCLSNDLSEGASYSYRLSPRNKYVVYYDANLRNYCSYTITTGVTRNITNGTDEDWINQGEEDTPDSIHRVNPDYHWAVDDQSVFIQSKDDVLEADPSGKLPAVRLTGKFGQARNVQFRFADLYFKYEKTIEKDAPLLLKVISQVTRDEGYGQVLAGRENKLNMLKLMPCHFEMLQKARDAEIYCVQMESAEQSPNQFITTDFKTFIPLTDNHPESAYNGVTSQLFSFKTSDGKSTQGILFRPENFDPKKRYPVIFEYYEREIVGLHEFPDPHYTDGGSLDIATYVSNGYLVFTPDIHYSVGYPGPSACNSIVGAAHFLMLFPWVDKAHMALMGHSFGGFETNYVITHSHLFAAAVSMSGMTDFVSVYGSIIGDGSSRQRQYELYRDRIGATLWQRTDLYLENSPVLRANQITTPVLMMANKKDADVPYEQGFELFTALRRLGKKAWMLQYDNGGHEVFNLTDQKDLTIRIAQFINYYLKGEPPPKWMVEGISATEKGLESGYELMPGREP